MIICRECFRDPEIRLIVSKGKNIGDCPTCGAKEVSLFDTEEKTELGSIFESLLSVYTPQKDLPDGYPDNDLCDLASCIQKDWSIFSDLPEETITQILKEIVPTLVKDFPSLFSMPIGVPERYDTEYLRAHSILNTAHWSDFVEAIKHHNRFHTNMIDHTKLSEYCAQISINLFPGKQKFYRGRIAHNNTGYTVDKMGAPPADRATDGRANSAGISRLYLTDNKDTTFHEVRAAEFDYVTVGVFELLSPIRIVNLSQIGNISPFSNDGLDITALLINKEHLKKINQEMAHPMRRGDSPLDYLPTQYICDFIMSIKDDDGNPMYDGIQYQSAMHSLGSNYTIFYPDKFRCISCQTYEVTKLKFEYK